MNAAIADEIKQLATKCYAVATDELSTERDQATWEAIAAILLSLSELARKLNRT